MNVSENELQAEEGRQVKSNPPPPPGKMAKNSPPLPVLSRSDRALRHKQGPSPQTGPFQLRQAPFRLPRGAPIGLQIAERARFQTAERGSNQIAERDPYSDC